MNVYQAIEQVRAYWRTTNPSEDDTFLYTEALNYLIQEAKDPRAMMELGGYYYGLRRFDLALKYYEMAAAMDSTDAYEWLPVGTEVPVKSGDTEYPCRVVSAASRGTAAWGSRSTRTASPSRATPSPPEKPLTSTPSGRP